MRHTFTFTSTDSEYTSSVSANAETLTEVLEAFTAYLRGAGYVFSGEVVIADD